MSVTSRLSRPGMYQHRNKGSIPILATRQPFSQRQLTEQSRQCLVLAIRTAFTTPLIAPISPRVLSGRQRSPLEAPVRSVEMVSSHQARLMGKGSMLARGKRRSMGAVVREAYGHLIQQPVASSGNIV